MKKATICVAVLGATLLFFLPLTGSSQVPALTDIELLGKYIFWDKTSEPERMACVTCHHPQAGWTFKDSETNLHQVAVTGANPHTVGNLKPPTNAYATFIEFFQNPCTRRTIIPSGVCGGNFWNGRSIGFGGNVQPGSTRVIDDSIFLLGKEYPEYLIPTADQALNPFPNPVEQNIEELAVCHHVESSKYAGLFETVFGEPINCSEQPYPGSLSPYFDVNYRRIAVSLAAYQDSQEVNSFTSRRDIALQRELDGIDLDDTPGRFPLVSFTAQENLGHDLFYGRARCTACHLSSTNLDFADGTDPLERYADDGYHFIGTPVNPEIPDPGNVSDLGLAGHTGCGIPGNPPCPPTSVPFPPFFIDTDHRGLQKTATLRNVDKRPPDDPDFIKAYTHNGFFKSLESIVHFYNTAFLGNCVVTDEEDCTGPGEVTYEETTAFTFGVTRCDPDLTWTEEEALAANCWPEPAVNSPFSAIPAVVGDLGLSAEEEAAIVAYLKTLSDTYTPKQPKPWKVAK
jgi:cytochrome c peroxidase